MIASWAGLGLGNPSGKGNLNGVAATPAAAMERARSFDEELKCMMRMGMRMRSSRQQCLILGLDC